MDRACLVEQLKVALAVIRSEKGTVEKRDECPSSEFVVRMSCYAAFFVVADSAESLVGTYETAENEIVALRGVKGDEWPRDLELVLVVAGDELPDPGLVRRIADDRYVCRKFVLWPNGQPVGELLADLPFWPPGDLLAGVLPLIGAGVQETVTGHDPHLIVDLASHSPGAERVFEKIVEDKYAFSSEPSRGEATPPRRAAPVTLAKLEALDITDFRGIRRLRSADMPLSGDVVFIYGPNGVGKTSIADALEWAITGQVNRLQQRSSWPARGAPDPIINIFSDTSTARVSCRLSNREPICRTWCTMKGRKSTERLIGSQRAPDDHAVIDHVVGTKAPTGEAKLRIKRLRDLFRGSHMLSQHDIRQFLEQARPDERFDILTNMIGAAEFVRFREKAAAVMRHLRSHVRAVADESRSLKRELGDVSARLRERQKDLDKVRQAVTADRSPDDLAVELLAGLRECHCAVDEALVERAGTEPGDRRLEIVAVHAETVIRGKRAEIEDLLVRLKGVERGLQGYTESRTQCERLATEIASAKNAAVKAGADLEKQEKALHGLQVGLRNLKTRQSEAARLHANLAWLRENLPTYAQAQGALRRGEDSLAAQRKELQTLEEALEEKLKALGVKRGRLHEIEQAMAEKTSRGQAVAALMQRLPDLLAKRNEAAQLDKKERSADSQIGELRRELSRAQNEVNAAQARLSEVQRAYGTEADRHDVLSSFLPRLVELVRSAECPLCGRRFSSADEAKAGIQEHLSCVPAELRDLARQLDEAKKDAEAKQAQVNTTTERIRALEAEAVQMRSAKAAAQQEVQGFLSRCANLAIEVSGEDSASWGDALQRALKGCETDALRSEATGLKDAINALASGAQQKQNVLDGLRRRVALDGMERAQRLSAIQGLGADMAQRGFDPGSLPEGERLAGELEKAREATRELGEMVAKKEAELRTAEAAVTGLRERIKTASEDVASKEAQLQQYESACNRFVAECHAIGVDPGNPKQSVGATRRSAAEQMKTLANLENARQVLQQLVGLERLKHEIDGLSRTQTDLRRKTEASTKEESRLQEWLTCLRKLEAEVVRQQVNVVGAHLERLEPTTQRLYHRLSPHPIFGTVRIRVDEETRELDIEAVASVASERLGGMAVPPSAFFSDAQMNALAITVFLAGALRQRWSGFRTILIDDPVQQMDEMNVCAFLDLIRGLSAQRQFIVFTCSREFYLLALDKLDCLNKMRPGSFLGYRLEGIAPAQLKVHRDAP